MIGVQVRREPEWDREQRELLQAYIALEADRGPHGIPMSRATAPGAKFSVDPMPIRDHAQAALSRAQKKYYDEYPDADRSSDVWLVDEDTPAQQP